MRRDVNASNINNIELNVDHQMMEMGQSRMDMTMASTEEGSSDDLFGRGYADIIDHAANIGSHRSSEVNKSGMNERDRIIMASKKAQLPIDSVHPMDASEFEESERKEILHRMSDRLTARLRVGT